MTIQAWHTANGDDEKIREAHAWGGKQERGQWVRVRKAQRGLESEHAGKAAIKLKDEGRHLFFVETSSFSFSGERTSTTDLQLSILMYSDV